MFFHVKIDAKGGIVIPPKVLKLLKVRVGDALSFTMDNNEIILTKTQ